MLHRMATLTDIEDRLLAMCEGEPVTIELARAVLGSWYARKIGHAEIVQTVNRLTRVKLAKWQYARGAKTYFTHRWPRVQPRLRFRTTIAGEAYLAQPRDVR